MKISAAIDIVLWILATLFLLASAYGWWFHFSVGPTHGPGAEIGLLGGAAALFFILVGFVRWVFRVLARERRGSDAFEIRSD